MSLPPFTPEQISELARLAIDMALYAPNRQGAYTFTAGVRWDQIHAVRAILDEAGVPWRDHSRNARTKRYQEQYAKKKEGQ